MKLSDYYPDAVQAARRHTGYHAAYEAARLVLLRCPARKSNQRTARCNLARLAAKEAAK